MEAICLLKAAALEEALSFSITVLIIIIIISSLAFGGGGGGIGGIGDALWTPFCPCPPSGGGGLWPP
jgi:hypothetical protein